MAITKLEDGRWTVDVRVSPVKRFRKTFKTKGEALRFESHVENMFGRLPRPSEHRALVALRARGRGLKPRDDVFQITGLLSPISAPVFL